MPAAEDTNGSSGDWKKVGGKQQNSKGQKQKSQGNPGWGDQRKGQQMAGEQQKKTQSSQGWGCKQKGQENKTIDKPKAAGSQYSSNSSSSSSLGGWQVAGGQQKKTQEAQGWGGQQAKSQGQQQLHGQQNGYQSKDQAPQPQQRPQGQRQGSTSQQSQRPQGQQQGSHWQQNGYQSKDQAPQPQQRPQGQQQGSQWQQKGYQSKDQAPQQMQRPQGQQQGQQQGPQHGFQIKGPAPQNGFSQLPQVQQPQEQVARKPLPQQQQVAPPRGTGPQEQRSQSQPAGIIKRGTIGKPGQVGVNYLDINMDKMPKTAYHYDVKIEPERPKKFWRQAFEQFRMIQLGGAIAAYDGRASCYSVDILNTSSSNGEVMVVDGCGHSLRYTVEIKETGDLEVDLNSLRNYMSERIFDKPMRAMQCLEVVMAAPCHSKAIRCGRSFFKMSEPGQRRELEDGYEALVGLYQAFVLGDRPFLNVDISHKSFPMDMPVLEYLERFGLKQRVDQNTDLNQSRRFIEPFLKGLYVVYTPPKSFGSSPRCCRINGLSRDPAYKETFEMEGKYLTIADYFKGRNYKLQFPKLLCLHIGSPLKNILVPIELCHILGGQALSRKDEATQVANMIKFAATSTNERKGKIMDLLKFFKHNLDPTISRFGIRIANDFITVQTRTLLPPQVEYLGKKWCPVRNGSWRMDNMRFLESKPKAHKWAILYYDAQRGRSLHYNQVADFEQKVLYQAKAVSVSLESRAEIRAYRDERNLDDCFRDLQGQCDLAFVIIPLVGVTYATVKQKAELQYGILTQCIKQFTVERKLNPQTVGNILLKVNSKLNGINHKLKDDPRLPMLRNAMFLGADVSHPSPDQREIPSVVGVAASHDPFGGAYNMQYRLQRSALEEIEDMESITLEHLRVYQKYHNGYPEHILYYRDGVSDGQFPKIKHEELRGIKAACRKLSIKPKICCIIVVKRHHTRFFPSGQPSQYNKFNNVDPGTVVDRIIVHPNEVQFFMVSHQSIQGTAKPTRYNVIENTGGLDIDLLQQITFNLCHMFPRCTRSVSYPAPAYLAHLVAARGRNYLTGTEKFMDLKKEYSKRRIVAEFMNTNPMFFV